MTEFELALLREAEADRDEAEEWSGEILVRERHQARYQIALSLAKRGYLRHIDTITDGGKGDYDYLFGITDLGRAAI